MKTTRCRLAMLCLLTLLCGLMLFGCANKEEPPASNQPSATDDDSADGLPSFDVSMDADADGDPSFYETEEEGLIVYYGTDLGYLYGVVCETPFTDETTGAPGILYTIELKQNQYDHLAGQLTQTPRATGQTVPTEIQLDAASSEIDLSAYVGRNIVFTGSFFPAHLEQHVREIVFEITEIRDVLE